MLTDYGPLLFLTIAAILFPAGGIITSWVAGRLRLRPHNPNPVKNDTYECGVETIGPSWVQFNFRYYYFALLFVVFDVESIFLLPWALHFKLLGPAGVGMIAAFLGVLTVGLAYAWRKRALEWV